MHVIETASLRLVTLGPDTLRASLAGDRDAAEALLGAGLPAPSEWGDLTPLFRMRLEQLEHAPELEPWLTRAVVARREAAVVGVSGFHGPPGGAWLREHAPEGLELGYTIFAPWRRRGFATEAAHALVHWAHDAHGVERFVLSIGPDNRASLGVARRLGFRHAGAWTHAERGLELVYLRALGPP